MRVPLCNATCFPTSAFLMFLYPTKVLIESLQLIWNYKKRVMGILVLAEMFLSSKLLAKARDSLNGLCYLLLILLYHKYRRCNLFHSIRLGKAEHISYNNVLGINDKCLFFYFFPFFFFSFSQVFFYIFYK